MISKMLCNECNTREATIHLTQIVGETMTKRDLCEVCGKGIADMVIYMVTGECVRHLTCNLDEKKE